MSVEVSTLEKDILLRMWLITDSNTRTWVPLKEIDEKESSYSNGQIRQAMVGLRQKGLVEKWRDGKNGSPWKITDDGKLLIEGKP